jgi:uncharacterized lipoprotein YajG
MGRAALFLAAACGLAACSAQPRLISQAPPGVSYRFEGDNIADANVRAEQYCQQYDKHARLQTVNNSGDDKIAVYDCN